MSSQEIAHKKFTDAVSGEKYSLAVRVIDGEIALAVSREPATEIEIRMKREDIQTLIKWLEKASLVAKYGV